MSASNFPVLHLYAQPAWHDDAVIAGTREALVALRRMVDTALERGTASGELFINDGEGFRLRVAKVTGKTVDALATPYTEEMAAEARDTAVWPWQLEDIRKE